MSAESEVVAALKLEASRLGLRLWRNNVGAATDANGNHFRYGLANESAAMSKAIKSADLIGIRPVLIMPHHVGHIIGQFVSREAKAPGWLYTGTPREVAQLAWRDLVIGLGGDACFATGEGTL